ncbi:MAG: 3',5'-cyclic adenosine monophosphate phosphodiesterase CpdA [Stenotrophomonas maltophilia]|nr:MAG: 3',5'-cyclic adenosine monophosphate phosphodiesterase CpdA [Stenotrophomonas maltophilia]
MRIRVLSDLHHEHFDGARALPAIEADLVVLAGDIHEHLQGLHWARETFGDTPIVYVAGNHEFYNADLPELTQAMRNLARALDIHFLADDAVELGDLRILGSTLWTDFGLYGAEREAASLQLAQSEMPDFQCIDHFTAPFTAALSQSLCRASCEWLEQRLSEPFAGRTLVVSHHAPSERSIPEAFRGDALSPAFASNLDALVQRCDLWIHGHVHQRQDYRLGQARVLANPGGYPGEDSGFDPCLVIDL